VAHLQMKALQQAQQAPVQRPARQPGGRGRQRHQVCELGAVAGRLARSPPSPQHVRKQLPAPPQGQMHVISKKRPWLVCVQAASVTEEWPG
jgi:hypothetical protein